MRIGIIGRSEILYDTVLELKNAGHEICFIITSKEAPEYKKKSEDFYELSKRLNIPFEKGSDIIKFKGLIKKEKPDVGVSLNFTKIIPKEIIDLFPLGILNAHGGDLPKYRGNACQAWAILNGEKRIGLCIHKMVGNELDNGDIIAKDYLKIDDNTKITEILNWIKINTKTMYLNVINKLEEKPNFILEKQSKNAKDILRCYPRQPQDGRIKWNKTSIYIHRLINASNKPYSGAYCFFKEKNDHLGFLKFYNKKYQFVLFQVKSLL